MAPKDSTRRRRAESEPLEHKNGGKNSATKKAEEAPKVENCVDEEEELEEPVDVQMLERVADMYWKVRAEFEKEVATAGAATFEESRKQRVKYEVRHGGRPKPLNLKAIEPTGKQPSGTLKNWAGQTLQKAPLYKFSHVKPLPAMQYWVLTEVNVLAEDEYTLSHVPFLGDSVDDSKFYDELMQTFRDGIHGTKKGMDEYINDWILYYTVRRILVKEPKSDDKALRHILRHVYELFPNKGSIDSLVAMYPDLQARFEPETVKRLDMTNEKGELTANFAPARLLNSYEVLLCHRCFSYDCSMHNATIWNGYGNKKKRQPPPPRQDNKEPCSTDCYLNAPPLSPPSRTTKLAKMFQSQKGSSSTSKSPATKPTAVRGRRPSVTSELKIDVWDESDINPPSNIAGWTPHEEAMFGLIRESAGGDYCKLTEVLAMLTTEGVPKTCRQVYEYARRTAPLSPRVESSSQLSPNRSPAKSKKARNHHRNFRAIKWSSNRGKVENQSVYLPCQHEGPCSKENGCRCVGVDNLCTKYCACQEDCPYRFPGCRCAPGNCRTKQCQCYYASWECDPDVCKSCNCDKFDSHNEPICRNISIQRGLQKKLIVAPSQVAGWGCYAAEDIEKNEFVSEYCGEVITQEESERRGKIYDKIKCSYLFGLNDDQVVDATRKGNVIRFANHSSHPNCRAKVLVVNGDHKIGIFANRQIKAGEEIFFDYAYNKSQQVQFVPNELPRSHAKTTLLKADSNAACASGSTAEPSTSAAASRGRKRLREQSVASVI
ncbi:SET domain containing protein [Aphelenchoides avenae]|nr:SET domain containing protein [Aphelenchus avenae]